MGYSLWSHRECTDALTSVSIVAFQCPLLYWKPTTLFFTGSVMAGKVHELCESQDNHLRNEDTDRANGAVVKTK